MDIIIIDRVDILNRVYSLLFPKFSSVIIRGEKVGD